MKNIRQERLQKELLRIIRPIFKGELSDKRLLGIEITRVKISTDLKKLKLFFSDFDENIEMNEIKELLEKSSGFIKKQIAGAGIMRTIPDIVFQYDKANERIERIDDIFRTIAEEKRNSNYYDDDSDNDYYDDDLSDDDLDDYDDDYDDDLDDDDLDFDYDDVDLIED